MLANQPIELDKTKLILLDYYYRCKICNQSNRDIRANIKVGFVWATL